MVLAAAAGSWKPQILDGLIEGYRWENTSVYLLDWGLAHKPLCAALSGSFLTVDIDTKFCFNPFSLVRDIYADAGVLSSILIAMAYTKNTHTTPKDGEPVATAGLSQELQGMLILLWVEFGSALTPDIVASRCLLAQNESLVSLGRLLAPFTCKGCYGHLFNGANNFKLVKGFQVFDFCELDNHLKLQQVLKMQLLYQIAQAIESPSAQRTVIIVEDALSFIASGDSEFCQSIYNRTKKLNCAVLTVCQSITEVTFNAVGATIVQNSATLLLTGQKDFEIVDFQASNLLRLSAPEFNQCHRGPAKKGEWLTMFYSRDNGAESGVGVYSYFANPL